MTRTTRKPSTLAYVAILSLFIDLEVKAGSLCTPGPPIGYVDLLTTVNAAKNCIGLWSCYVPQIGAIHYQTDPPTCDPTTTTCSVKAFVPATFPGNNNNTPASLFIGSPASFDWYTSGLAFIGSCGLSDSNAIRDDHGESWIQVGNFSCGNPVGMTGADTYSVTVRMCDIDGMPNSCRKNISISVPVTPPAVAAALCPPPPMFWGCGESSNSCQQGCVSPAGGLLFGGSSAAGGPPSFSTPASGPGADLYYAARGIGHVGSPKPADWTTLHGRYWSHDYAERIVQDPGVGHVWLLTRHATYREFTDAGLDGLYETVKPSDEYRTLTKTVGGWELSDLDGTVDFFNNSGSWLKRSDRYGNEKVATYTSGRLSRVDFPDGRREDFGYTGGGRLQTITEVGVDGVTSRVWTYTWTGDDLTRIDRPDGTAYLFNYGDVSKPGFVTRVTLEGIDNVSTRVAAVYEYDSQGNVLRTWRGDTSFAGPNAVEKWSFSYDNPVLPVTTTITDPLGLVSTQTFGRDTDTIKPKLSATAGDCPTCGLGPNSQIAYTDAANPLRPTAITDGRGFDTVMTYNSDGMITSQVEAFGEAEERQTTWDYDPNFPAIVSRIERPSTNGNPLNFRVEDHAIDAFGNPTATTIEGFEAGSPFSFDTERIFSPEGMIEEVDPPGFGVADITTFTYDTIDRGGLVIESRTDPIVGTTDYEHDPFNRQAKVTDVNGILTDTEYDLLDRVTFVRDRGALVADDLVTEHRYTTFGDLFQMILAKGNVVEYSYDTAGRLISIEQKADSLPATRGQRQFFTLNAFGRRTKVERQAWNGSAWVTQSEARFEYANRCQLKKAIEGSGLDESTTEYAYDCNGNVEKVWDPNHPSSNQTAPATTTHFYDALDRLKEVRQPFGGAGGGNVSTKYEYDVQDHLKKVTDGEGTITTYVTSDRDLMTSEVSEVSATTTYVYNAHGELSSQTDTRGITLNRTLDAADRVTLLDYPGTSLDVAYTYDDPLVPFSKGRLTKILRDGHAVDYRYDRFGRVTQDGELKMSYDKNGNSLTIEYPHGMVASYTHDFADREATLQATIVGGSPLSVVSASSYRAFGPLLTATLGNGLAETRTFNTKNELKRVQAGALLDWNYTLDKVGNITAIADLVPANNKSYAYQDFQYFLTTGNGPWGTRSWTYDKVGNRLTETRGATTDTYSYTLNGVGGRSPKLDFVTQGLGGLKDFSFDPAGNETQVNVAGNVIGRTYDVAGRMATQARTAAQASSNFLYDGRGYLRKASGSAPAAPGTAIFCDGFESGDTSGWGGAGSTCFVDSIVLSTYSSAGVLYATSSAGRTRNVLHFGGRPVAFLEEGVATVETGTESQPDTLAVLLALKFLTTDHLGTPILMTSNTGTSLWSGGLEPFGADWNGAQTAGMFLRFSGQWEDASWAVSGLGSSVAYNVNRWYEVPTGRYSSIDPIQGRAGMTGDYYRYAINNPVRFFDPLGLFTVDESCDGCVHPHKAKDNRQLTQIAFNETNLWCNTRLNEIVDVGLRKCIDESCKTGVISCSKGGGDRCDQSGVQGYSSGGTSVTHWLRRNGVYPKTRRSVLCSENPLNYEGSAGETTIHEWAHGCGYSAHGPVKIPGIPHSELE